MQTKQEPKQLNVTKQIEDIEQMYNDMMGKSVGFSMLEMGIYGSGKTRMSCTGRLPILVDVFDPRGTLIFHTDPHLSKLREEKKIILRPFWTERSNQPTEYRRWEQQWQEDCRSGFLSLFGTYVIDSGTTQLEAMSNYIRQKKSRGDNLQVQDYIPMYNQVMDIIKVSSSQGCDFVYIGHLLTVQDEVTGEVKAELDTYNRLRSKIPKLFSEKYVIAKKKSPRGVEHIVLTHSTGRYEASSQLAASGKLNIEEEPNIKNMLKKAGLESNDKPIPWLENEQ